MAGGMMCLSMFLSLVTMGLPMKQQKTYSRPFHSTVANVFFFVLLGLTGTHGTTFEHTPIPLLLFSPSCLPASKSVSQYVQHFTKKAADCDNKAKCEERKKKDVYLVHDTWLE
jgi:hypothetical protein